KEMTRRRSEGGETGVRTLNRERKGEASGDFAGLRQRIECGGCDRSGVRDEANWQMPGGAIISNGSDKLIQIDLIFFIHSDHSNVVAPDPEQGGGFDNGMMRLVGSINAQDLLACMRSFV